MAGKKLTNDEFLKRFYQNNKNAHNIELLSTYKGSNNKIKCRCKIDGYIWNTRANNLSSGGYGCPLCSHKVTVEGINDISTLYPELVKYFKYENDSKKYSLNSRKKVWFICPVCSHEKYMEIHNFKNNGFNCPMCGDHSSYPNKFAHNLLAQLNVENLIFEYHPDWAGNRYYDNYFEYKGKAYIIEMDGGFHYSDNNMSGQTSEESQKIDLIKDNLAKEHNIKVIRIDCRYSSFKYIKENILSSYLSEIFDLSTIDWNSCDKAKIGYTSKTKEICDYYNNINKNVTNISKYFNLDISCIYDYLHKGTNLGFCNFIPTDRRKGVYVLKNNDIIHSFDSVKDCAHTMQLLYNTRFDSSRICECCKNKRKYYKDFVFKYKEELKEAG